MLKYNPLYRVPFDDVLKQILSAPYTGRPRPRKLAARKDEAPVVEKGETGNAGANTFHVIDIRTDTKIFSIGTTGDDAHAIAETPNGKEIWIGNRDSGTIEIRDGRSPDYDLIEVINLADPQHGLGPGIHKPDLFGFSPNGKAFYSILREPDNMVIKIDVATRTVVGSRFMGGEPHGLRVRALSD